MGEPGQQLLARDFAARSGRSGRSGGLGIGVSGRFGIGVWTLSHVAPPSRSIETMQLLKLILESYSVSLDNAAARGLLKRYIYLT
jgi:hypothetical protein